MSTSTPDVDATSGEERDVLRALLEGLSTGALLLDAEGRIVTSNVAWQRVAAERGFASEDSAPERSFLDLCACAEPDASSGGVEIRDGLRAVLRGERAQFQQECRWSLDGSERWSRLTVRRAAAGGFTGALVLHDDVTARRELASRHLRDGLTTDGPLEHALLGAVLAQMPLGVMIGEAPSGRLILHNERLVQLVGLPINPAGSALLSAGGRAYHPDGRSYAPEEYPLARALRGESVFGEAIEHERADGTRVVLRASAGPVLDEGGEIIAAVVAFGDITQWKVAERQLRESETRYRLASRAIKDAIWDWNVVADCIAWSDGITARFGHPPETIEPSIDWWLKQIEPSERERVRESIVAALEGRGDIWHDEYRFRRFDGGWADVIDRGFIVRDEHGHAIRAVGAMEDVSERRRADGERAALLERERRARADAEAANRAKDEFLAVVSHELRTPLTPILGFVDMLRDEDLDREDARAALSRIERNALSLAHLIDDLLDVSRITSGKLSLEYQPLHLQPIVAAVVESARPTADAKGVRLVLDLDADQDLVAGDAPRLTQVVANLLANAVKFTSSGGEVRVAVSRRSSRVRIGVCDTGRGIAADLLPYVFERFRQGDTSDTRVHGGLGLGLAIVHDLIALHGGTVHAESGGADKGATFTVILPLMRPHLAGRVRQSHE